MPHDAPARIAAATVHLFSLAAATALLLPGCRSDEVCDWEDNDGDGVIDEGFDVDGDGWWACGLTQEHLEGGAFDCDDAAPAVNPDAFDGCDGLDNNCDGVIDPGCGTLCRSRSPGVAGAPCRAR